MPTSYTAAAIEQMNAVSASELPVMLVQIDHPDLPDPVRVTNNAEDVVHNGETFIALAFRLTPPDDLSQGLPRARISIDNVGGQLMEFLEVSAGGLHSSVTLTQVLPSAPDTVQWQIAGLSLTGVAASTSSVDASLTYEPIADRVGCAITHSPERSPGLY